MYNSAVFIISSRMQSILALIILSSIVKIEENRNFKSVYLVFMIMRLQT